MDIHFTDGTEPEPLEPAVMQKVCGGVWSPPPDQFGAPYPLPGCIPVFTWPRSFRVLGT